MFKVIMLTDNTMSANYFTMVKRIIGKANIPLDIVPVLVTPNSLLQNKIGKSGNALKELEAKDSKREQFDQFIADVKRKHNAKAFIINETGSLAMVSGQTSLSVTRGSRYVYSGEQFFVVDSVKTINTPIMKGDSKGYYGKFVFLSDMQKIVRHCEGKTSEPKFHYRVARTVESLSLAIKDLGDCSIISYDIETAGKPAIISCIGFTGLRKDGGLISWVIPLVFTPNANQAYWNTVEEEVQAWKAIQCILANEAVKVAHNGQYDNSYLIKFNCPANNYIGDTMSMWWSYQCETPKSLKFVTSLCSDYYRYWKDEIKGGDADKGLDTASKIPVTPEGMERYWRYNALDTYFTILDFIKLVPVLIENHWALKNYSDVFRLDLIYTEMGLHGLACCNKRMKSIVARFEASRTKALRKLKYCSTMTELNPASVADKQRLIYGVLGAVPVRGKKGTDQVALAQVQYQHPFFKIFTDLLKEVLVPNKMISDFQNYTTDNNRALYKLSATGTVTSRASSAQHHFWVGRNMQNISPKIRESFTVDSDNQIMFDIDYSQSDNYFVAYESEDPHCMEVVSDDRDTHCVHQAHFFKMSYEEAVADPKKKDTHSLRSCAKKVVHGCNYAMGSMTMFYNVCKDLGKEALINAASALGYQNAYALDDSELVGVCSRLIASYSELYPYLKTWKNRCVTRARSKGNTLTTAFGFTRYFNGDLESNDVQRQLVSFLGQGGTGGNINRTLLEWYYGTPEEKSSGLPSLKQRGLKIYLQVHDSLVGVVDVHKSQLITALAQIMERPVEINGRVFMVPTECDVGMTWSKSMLKYKQGMQLSVVHAHENKVRAVYGEKPLPPLKEEILL